MRSITRRSVLRSFSAVPAAGLAGFWPGLAQAAPEFTFKYGNNLPVTHPLNVRANEAAARVLADSKGRMEIKVFPNNQLGGDTDMQSQVRSGGIEMFTPGIEACDNGWTLSVPERLRPLLAAHRA